MQRRQNINLPKNFDIAANNVEGAFSILAIEGLQQDTKKRTYTLLLTIISCGFFLLILKWFPKMQKRFIYIVQNDIRKVTHFYITNKDGTISIVKSEQYFNPEQKTTQTVFYNKLLRYYYSQQQEDEQQQQQQQFRAVEYMPADNSITYKHILQHYSQGLTNQQSQQRLSIYGQSKMDIPVPKYLPWIGEELQKPFFVLQYFSVALWIIENVYVFSATLIGVTVVLTTLSFYLIKLSMLKLREMSLHKHKIRVKRRSVLLNDAHNNDDLNNNLNVNHQFEEINQQFVVPGDIFEVQNNQPVPCDCLLIQGETLVNEAMLTGETVPVPKFAIQPSDNECFNFSEGKRNIMFEGTTVIQKRDHNGNNKVLALAVRTSFSSLKGQLIRTILFPQKFHDRFFIQVIKFIVIFGCINMILYAVMLRSMIQDDFPVFLKIIRFFDFVLWVVPPAMPIFFNIALALSLVRLKTKGVLGFQQNKIMDAGRVQIACFDKTGTLTQNNIDVKGIKPATQCQFRHSVSKHLVELNRHQYDESIMFQIMASCHTVQEVDGVQYGDSLDIKMLEFTKYQLDYQNVNENYNFIAMSMDGALTIKVLRIFEFASEYQRMSVVAQVQQQQQQRYRVYMKGAPEKMHKLSVPDSLPANYFEELNTLAIKGYRILSLAYKDLKSFDQCMQITREQAESEVIFVGFLILENQLKKDSKDVVGRLRQGGLGVKIISGDQLLTTINTARQAGIMNKAKRVIVCDINSDTNANVNNYKIEIIDGEVKNNHNESLTFNSEVISKEIDLEIGIDMTYNKQQINAESQSILSKEQGSNILNKDLDTHMIEMQSISIQHGKQEKTTQIYTSLSQLDTLIQQSIQQSQENDQCEIAISGGFWEKLLQESNSNQTPIQCQARQMMKQLLCRTAVFARARPEQKREIVECLQKVPFCVAMTGDGANDCSAIKQADVGISFSQADASFSAPFSAIDDSIKCVEMVILEGRACLSTGVEIFRTFMAIAFTKAVSVVCMTTQGFYFHDMQFIFMNYLGTIPMQAFVSLSVPLPILSKELPYDNFFSSINLFSIFGQMLWNGLCIVVSYVLVKKDLTYPLGLLVDNDGTRSYRTDGMLNTVMFLDCLILSQFSMIAFYISTPFKERIYQNIALTAWLGITLFYDVLMLFSQKASVSFAHTVYIDGSFRIKLAILLASFMVIIYAYEEIFVKIIIKRQYYKKQHLKRLL